MSQNISITYGRRITWGETVTEAEHEAGLEAYEAALESGIRALYPEASVRVRAEGHDGAARVTVDSEDVSERRNVARVLDAAFAAGCEAIGWYAEIADIIRADVDGSEAAPGEYDVTIDEDGRVSVSADGRGGDTDQLLSGVAVRRLGRFANFAARVVYDGHAADVTVS